MTPYAHYTARALPQRYPFADTALARDVFVRLRRTFPDALAVVLMPDHLHMVAPDRGERSAHIVGKLLATSTRASGRWAGCWQPVEPPEAVTTADKLQRAVRYAWLNPCRPWFYRGHRTQLVDDPLAWSWSTLRDSIGAIADPWVPAERLAVAFGWPKGADLPERLHRYACLDDHVAPDARSFPRLEPPRSAPTSTVDEVLHAALATTRLPAPAQRQRTAARRIANGLCYRQGWRIPTQLAPIFGVHPHTVSRIAAAASNGELEAAALCLDRRLRVDPDTNLRHAHVDAA
ncbi:MAG: hypothetical protein RIF41_31500 [Polyangiaceae bacterium]